MHMNVVSHTKCKLSSDPLHWEVNLTTESLDLPVILLQIVS